MLKSLNCVILSLFIVFLAGCSVTEDREAANRFMIAYYDNISLGKFEDVLSTYGTQFFETTPRDEWLGTLKKTRARLGNLKSYELLKWKVEVGTRQGLSGIFVDMTYKVHYSLYDSLEELTLYRPYDQSKFHILKHQITSEGFLH